MTCLLQPLFLALVASALTPADWVANVQAAYQAGGDMQAQFTQTYADKLRGKRRRESGTIWAKKDGRVRWTYAAPENKDFVFDGKTAYFYEPDNAQVTVFERFADSPVAHALEFLWGRGDLRHTFSIQPCAADCPPAGPDERAVTLIPKEPLAAVDHVLLLIDIRAQRVRQSWVFDPLGNHTEYGFTDVRFGASLPQDRFSFTVPPGVSLLRAATDAAAPAPDKGSGVKLPAAP